MSSRGREKFKKFKLFLIFLSNIYKLLPLKLRKKLLVCHRMKRGTMGIAIRYALLKSICIHCGDNVSVHEGVYILEPQNLSVGNNVSIHPMCYIDAAGEIEIGNDVSIAHAVTIMSSTHNFEDKTISIKDQGVSKRKVTVCDNVWIGAKATVLCGNNIASGSVIGAGAVVTHCTEKDSVNVGVPAKAIKER